MKFFSNADTLTGTDKISYSGYLDISKDVYGPLEISIDLNRCDLEMKKCEKLPTQKHKNVCRNLNVKKTFYHNAWKTLDPPLECPFRAQRYTATNSSMDLTPFTLLPLSGYMWIITAKLYSGDEKARQVALCLDLNMKVVRVQRKRN